MGQIQVWGVYVPPNPSRGALSRRTVWAETEYGSSGPKVPTARSLPARCFVPHSDWGLTYAAERIGLSLSELLVKLPWWAQGAGGSLCDPPVTSLSQNTALTKKHFPLVASRHAPGCSSGCDRLLTEVVSPPGLPPSPQGLDSPTHLEGLSPPSTFHSSQIPGSWSTVVVPWACVCVSVCVCCLSVGGSLQGGTRGMR